MSKTIEQRLVEILTSESVPKRAPALCAIRESNPDEALDGLIKLMQSPDQTLRRRAGSSLGWFRQVAGRKAFELAGMLQHHADDRVRLSCAIHLMCVEGPVANKAFLVALADISEKVVQVACVEVGARGGSEGTTALFGMLGHPSWRVRLEVCKALITQHRADDKVVATLEQMSHEPEADVYNAEREVDDGFVFAILQTSKGLGMITPTEEGLTASGTGGRAWGKLDSIIARAKRTIA